MEADPGDKAGIGSDFEDKRAIYSRYRSNFSIDHAKRRIRQFEYRSKLRGE